MRVAVSLGVDDGVGVPDLVLVTDDVEEGDFVGVTVAEEVTEGVKDAVG